MSLAVIGLTEVRAPYAAAAEGSALEYQVKAVFLLRIAQFTDWPAKPAGSVDPFVIGVLGEDPFGSYLDQAAESERIGGRVVVVRRYAAIEQLGPSDLLFVAESHRGAFARVLRHLSGARTLTVADFAGFIDDGGAIELFLDEGRVRFRVGRRAVAAAGLSLRSQLLRVAATVE